LRKGQGEKEPVFLVLPVGFDWSKKGKSTKGKGLGTVKRKGVGVWGTGSGRPVPRKGNDKKKSEFYKGIGMKGGGGYLTTRKKRTKTSIRINHGTKIKRKTEDDGPINRKKRGGFAREAGGTPSGSGGRVTNTAGALTNRKKESAKIHGTSTKNRDAWRKNSGRTT